MRTSSIRKGNDRLLYERKTGIPKATQDCWIRLHSSSNIVWGKRTWLWVVSFPPCTVGPNIVRSCSIRKLFPTVCVIENGVTMTPKRRSTDVICVIFYSFFDNEKTCLNNRSSNEIQRPFLSPTPTMVYTKETTTHSNRIIHTQLFANYLFIYNLVPRYGLGINLHVWILANQNQNNYC